MKLLFPYLILLLLIIASIVARRNVCKESKHCLLGLWLAIPSLFGMLAALGGWRLYGIPMIIVGIVSLFLHITGLYLIIKNKKFIKDWTDLGN